MDANEILTCHGDRHGVPFLNNLSKVGWVIWSCQKLEGACLQHWEGVWGCVPPGLAVIAILWILTYLGILLFHLFRFFCNLICFGFCEDTKGSDVSTVTFFFHCDFLLALSIALSLSTHIKRESSRQTDRQTNELIRYVEFIYFDNDKNIISSRSNNYCYNSSSRNNEFNEDILMMMILLVILTMIMIIIREKKILSLQLLTTIIIILSRHNPRHLKVALLNILMKLAGKGAFNHKSNSCSTQLLFVADHLKNWW